MSTKVFRGGGMKPMASATCGGMIQVRLKVNVITTLVPQFKQRACFNGLGKLLLSRVRTQVIQTIGSDDKKIEISSGVKGIRLGIVRIPNEFGVHLGAVLLTRNLRGQEGCWTVSLGATQQGQRVW